MTAILTALGRGYTSNRVLNTLANRFPTYANGIMAAQAAGFTSSQILKKIYKGKTGKELPEEAFMTEFEKSRKEDDKRKRNRALTTIGVLAAVGAGAAGLRYAAMRNAAIQPTAILPSIQRPGQALGIGQRQTLNVGPRQIGVQQQGIQNNPQQPPILGLPGPGQPQAPQAPQSPTPPQGPQSSPQTPIPAPYSPLKDALKDQRDPLKSLDLIRNLNVEPRFQTALKQGFDLETTSEMLKMILPKQVKEVLEKQPGGISSFVEDYGKYVQQNPGALEKRANQVSSEQSKSPENIQEINKAVEKIAPSQTPEQIRQETRPPVQVTLEPKPQQISSGIQPETRLAMTPKGQIGEVKSIDNGVANIDVNGKVLKEKSNSIQEEPEGIESAVRQVLDSIPESLKSTNLQSIVHIPGMNVLLSQFYDGKWAWYLDFPEDKYRQIAIGSYDPKTSGITGIAKYKPGVTDSRGAGFSKEVVQNPKYSKENKGKTWGYADNEYSLFHHIQPIIHKISKEKKDEQGNIKVPKARKKQ